MGTPRQRCTSNRRATVPRVMLLLALELAFVLLVTAVASLLALWVFSPAGHPWVLTTGLNAIFFYIPVRMMIVAVRVRRNIDAHEWMLCPKCEHDLRGLEADPLICPECGRGWTAEQIQRSWNLLVRRKSSG